MLSYMQGGMAEVWKDNILDEISTGMSVVQTVEELFTKIWQELGESDKDSRKVDELRVLEQGSKTVDGYMQEFRRAARDSGYEGRALVEEFKRGLNRVIRRRLAEAEMPLTTIGQWQERMVQLDCNMRQSRAEEKILGERRGNAACPMGNMQQPGEQQPSWNNQERLGPKRRIAEPEGSSTKANRRREGTRSNGCRQGTRGRRPKIFQLWRFWAHGLQLYNREACGQEWESHMGTGGRKGRGVKREWRSVGSHLPSYNKYSALLNRVMNKGLVFDNTKGVRDLSCMLWSLKEIWMQVGIEKVDNHKGVSVKALLDSGATGMFAGKKFVEKYSFKLEKLDRLVRIRNVDGTGNSGGLVTHEIKVNMYYQGHVERMKLDICDLERMEVILEMPWLAAHNPEINWKTGEVKIMRCPPLCGRNKERKEKQGRRRKREVEEEAAIRWAADDKED